MDALIDMYRDRADWFFQLTCDHLYLSGIAIVLASIAGLALGIFMTRHRQISKFVLAVCNVAYTIPAISMLGFLLPISGIGNTTAIVALTIYGLLPMIRNTYTGIDAIDPSVIEAAKAMGCTGWQMLFRIELPQALLVILAGFRNMVVMTISLAGIASYIGAGGLGLSIYRGITTNNQAMTIAGSLLIAALALSLDGLIGLYEKSVKKKRRLAA